MTRLLYVRKRGPRALFILVALSTVVVVGTAFYFWHLRHRQVFVESPARSSAQMVAQTLEHTSEGGYAVIPAWHVRFPLPNNLQDDLYYQAYTNAQGGQGVQFASKRLDGMVGDGYCTFLPQSDGRVYGTGITAGLSRINPRQPGEETLEYFKSQHTYITTIGDYEYYQNKSQKDPPASCTSERHPELNATEQGLSAELTTAFSKLTSAD